MDRNIKQINSDKKSKRNQKSCTSSKETKKKIQTDIAEEKRNKILLEKNCLFHFRNPMLYRRPSGPKNKWTIERTE